MGSFAAQDLGSLGKTALNVSLLVLKSALFFRSRLTGPKTKSSKGRFARCAGNRFSSQWMDAIWRGAAAPVLVVNMDETSVVRHPTGLWGTVS